MCMHDWRCNRAVSTPWRPHAGHLQVSIVGELLQGRAIAGDHSALP